MADQYKKAEKILGTYTNQYETICGLGIIGQKFEKGHPFPFATWISLANQNLLDSKNELKELAVQKAQLESVIASKTNQTGAMALANESIAGENRHYKEKFESLMSEIKFLQNDKDLLTKDIAKYAEEKSLAEKKLKKIINAYQAFMKGEFLQAGKENTKT